MACLWLVKNAIFFRFAFIINEHRSPLNLNQRKSDLIETLRICTGDCVLCVLLKCFWGTGWWCIELYHHYLNAWLFCCVNSMWFGSFSFSSFILLSIACASFQSFEFIFKLIFICFEMMILSPSSQGRWREFYFIEFINCWFHKE